MIRVNILCMECIDVAISAVECILTFMVTRVFTSTMPCVDGFFLFFFFFLGL
jgi:hypothetical protein